MNRKEIDKLWNKAIRESVEAGEMYTRYHFAALVAAAEREACAKVVDEMEKQRCEAWHQVLTMGGEVPSMSLTGCAAAIRARGETK